MAVLQMQGFRICALQRDRKRILEKLQELGISEIDVERMPKEEYLTRKDTVQMRQQCARNVTTLDRAIEVLELYRVDKVGISEKISDMFTGKRLIEKSLFEVKIKHAEQILQEASEILHLNKAIADQKNEIQKIENRIETLRPWIELEIPMTGLQTEKTVVFLEAIPTEMSKDEIREALEEHKAPDGGFIFDIQHSEKMGTYLTVISLKKLVHQLETAFRNAGFAKPSNLEPESPKKMAEEFNREIERLKLSVTEATESIQKKESLLHDIQIVRDYFEIESKKLEVEGVIAQSRSAFFISGYIPSKMEDLLNKAVGEEIGAAIEYREPDEKEQPPVLLQNNGFSRATEPVLASYGLPKRGEIDPTFIMSLFYVFFFGMMLSDAGYGFVLFLACFILYKKFPRMESGLREMIKLMMFGGLSSVGWGILFGSYFGDVVDTVSGVFIGSKVTIPALWFFPLQQPMRLLIVCLIFGMVHLFVGLGISAYLHIKHHEIKAFLFDELCWYLFLIGLILILLPTDIMAAIIQMKLAFPEWLLIVSRLITIIGAIGILLFAGRRAKNPAKRILLGVYSFYDVTGWLSDVLSYSRLLALGLATGVIASVINQMGSIMGRSVVSFILFVVVFLAGQTFSIFINVLSAYVHSNRLAYVEFFGKFYQGGAKPFEPFKRDTKYVDIQEDR